LPLKWTLVRPRRFPPLDHQHEIKSAAIARDPAAQGARNWPPEGVFKPAAGMFQQLDRIRSWLYLEVIGIYREFVRGTRL
jgi:hypothetical protein